MIEQVPIDPRELPPLPSPERVQELLFDAARIGRDDVIPALLHAGADPAILDPKGYTALILATYNGHAPAAAALIRAGADVDAPDGARGNTALMGVAFKGYTEVASLLVDAGAAIDRRNLAGQTALMNGAMFGHLAIVDLLLANGADPMAMDQAGNSPASLAAMQGNDAMVVRIRKAADR